MSTALTWSQRETLRRMQNNPDAWHSKQTLHCRLATLTKLAWLGYVQWGDDVDNGTEVISFFCLTNAGKNVQP